MTTTETMITRSLTHKAERLTLRLYAEALQADRDYRTGESSSARKQKSDKHYLAAVRRMRELGGTVAPYMGDFSYYASHGRHITVMLTPSSYPDRDFTYDWCESIDYHKYKRKAH